MSPLLDTGAAVALLRKDTWSQIKPLPWLAVSAGGTAFTVHGCVSVDLEMGSQKFVTDIVVVSSLMSEAILGLDFLMEQQTSINLTLHLNERGCIHGLRENLTVHAASKVEQVAGNIETTVDGVWVVEEVTGNHPLWPAHLLHPHLYP